MHLQHDINCRGALDYLVREKRHNNVFWTQGTCCFESSWTFFDLLLTGWKNNRHTNTKFSFVKSDENALSCSPILWFSLLWPVCFLVVQRQFNVKVDSSDVWGIDMPNGDVPELKKDLGWVVKYFKKAYPVMFVYFSLVYILLFNRLKSTYTYGNDFKLHIGPIKRGTREVVQVCEKATNR